MSVSDGNIAEASTFNNAFMSKSAESTTTGKQNLANTDAASGATVTNAQREINSLNSFSGRAAGTAHNVKPTWSSNDVGVSTDDLKTRIDLLTAQFNNLSGHDHSVSVTGKGASVIPASATVIGAVNLIAQTFAGLKTFQDGLTSNSTFTASVASILNGIIKIAQTVDAAATGADVDLATPSTLYYKFTNASLTSLRTIVAPSTQGMLLVITNGVGGAIDIKNETGTAADRILTGTGADLSLANNASLFLIYDFNSSRWRVVGGSGGSSAGGFTTYANENISASGSITSSTSVQMQMRRITGNGAAVTTSTTPFGAGGGWTDGTIIKLIGGSLSNTVTVPHNDAAKGAILNGACELALYDSLELQYDSTADRWIETTRSVK